jgi:succinate dehydrogenase/fumarate reductase flavoprotein subunit
LILTEGLSMGTSINTGSDKQTYYKLSLHGAEADSVRALAETYFAGGAVHGDLALVEASLSTRAFMHLVNLGVPFPRDEYGQFVGYKTDHDPRQRATSIGPYTSREMCNCLIREVRRSGIPVREQRTVIRLVVIREGEQRRAVGALALNGKGELETYLAENIIFAVGGPGGLYRASVYPEVHTGAIGLAFMAVADARNLPESQYGLASTHYRWNVSGTYMQVLPRFVSRDSDGVSNEREFLCPYFDSVGTMNGMVFLKGYQWPFDAYKAVGGSSLVDILVYIETEVKGRRVYLDFRRNPDGFVFDDLPAEALRYLTKSTALQATPLERLRAMNPEAVQLYLDHGIDLSAEPLEIAVSAQHNNGGLAGNIWWESINIKHLFPVGEVNGSHGLKRPGGASLNAGQVGGFRVAEFIANRYADWNLPEDQTAASLQDAVEQAGIWAEKCALAQTTWQDELTELQERMSRVGAPIRSVTELQPEAAAAWEQVHRLDENGCRSESGDMKQAFNTRQLCFAHAVYLDAIQFAMQSGVGSRGSSIVLDLSGRKVHPLLEAVWSIQAENESFRGKTLETSFSSDGRVTHRWADCHPIPESDAWFETAWARFRSGEIYRSKE